MIYTGIGQSSGNHTSWTVKKKKKKKNEASLRNLWSNIKYTNICIIGVPKGEDREKGAENTFESIVPENFLKVGKKKHSGLECTVNSNKMNPERSTSTHVKIKIAKIKEKILKAAREK